jgi:transmembrane sensor
MTDIDYNLLGKILTKEANDDEKSRFAEWLSFSDENREIFRAYREVYDESVITETHTKGKFPAKKDFARKSRNIKHYLLAAASVSLVLAIYFLFLSKPMEQPYELQLAETNMVIKTNPRGQKSRIILPDGSNVWLNSESRLEFEENFTDSFRKVILEGEAYFEVARDSSRPFVVESGDLTVNVLGTAFNINNFDENKLATVSLISGKLMIAFEDQQEVLLPGNHLQYFKDNHELIIRSNSDVEKITAWKNGILIFEREDFQSVIYRLEKWYDVNITINGNPPTEWRFTGYFENEYLRNVLEVLCYGKSLNYKIERKNVTLSMQ